MRCFIAIVLPETVQKKIAELQDELRRCGLKFKWVAPENIHLTLKFLGEITNEQANEVASVLETTAAATEAFDLSIEGIGQFPPKGTPRVVWLGAQGDTDPLAELESRIREGLDRAGIPYDKKPFHPHLTIARVDRGFRGPLRVSDKLRAFKAGGMNAARVELIKSDLQPTGAVYTSLSHADLQPRKLWGEDERGRILLPRYKKCFVCGSTGNPISLNIQFYVNNGRVETDFVAGEEHCGFEGVVHGGVLTALLDETMGWTVITHRPALCISAELTIRFKERTPAGRRLFISAECVDYRPRLMTARGEITDEDGTVFCTGQGKFVPLPDEELRQVAEYAGWKTALEEVFELIQSRNTSAE